METRTEHGTQGTAVESFGERLRRLRAAAGLTQSELADGRFTKEYVSQMERGKTRPTRETVVWLAARLGVEPALLETGVSVHERARLEAVLARGDALMESHRAGEAIPELRAAVARAEALGIDDVLLRALSAAGWAHLEDGQIRESVPLLQRAQSLVAGPGFSDLDRADVLFRLGVCRYKLSSVATAVALLSEALRLAEASGLPSDRLRADILGWRSRCYRRQRDFLAGREDVERALELADAITDERTAANVYFQASLIAEREGQFVLARTYAERAKAHYEELADRANVGKLLNNLGGLTFLLGNPSEAIAYLKDSFRILLDEGSDADAATVISSLAQVHLGVGEPELAEREARRALELLGGRLDVLAEIGNAQLMLGKALLEQGRLDEAASALGDADASFEQTGSASHRAAAWIALGDVATGRGDDREAARLYRHAAETLQDFRF